METFDNELNILETYRSYRRKEITFYGNPFKCNWIIWATRNIIFRHCWTSNNGKNDKGPDFYSKTLHLKMEVMRLDDCINSINGQHVKNSYEKENNYMSKMFGKNYKNTVNGTLIFIPNTANDKEFNYQGYLNNFKRTIEHHSSRINNYKNNPDFKSKIIFLVFDESNNYVQMLNKKDLEMAIKNENNIKQIRLHSFFGDNKFLEIIKNSAADYLIWVGRNKSFYNNGKEIRYPKICVYEVKKLKIKGVDFDSDLMYKLKKEYKR